MSDRARAPISAVIIARNAADRIADVLASVDMCAERLVLDSGSTDATVAVARGCGARVEHQPFLGYGPQKRRAVALARHDWILSLDADEVLDETARSACAALDLSDPARCFRIRRRTFIGDREVRHGCWRGESVVRLFNRTTANFKPLLVHEEVEAGSSATLLPGSMLHYSYADCRDVIARSLRYAPLKARVMQDRGERIHGWAIPLRGLAAFAKSYVLRSGWRDGPAGFVIAVARVVDSTLPRALVLGGRVPADPVEAGPAPSHAGSHDPQGVA